MRKQTLTYLLPLMLLVSACGGSEKQSQQPESGKTQEQQNSQAQTDEVRTIDIIGIDQMKYVVKEEGKMIGTAETVTSGGETYLLLQNIKAQAGEELRIRLTTVSDLPASAMSHNWILLKMGVDPAKFANAAVKAKNNDYIPQDRADDLIAHTGLAAGGETVEVTFTVPKKTGEYDYLCSFPGHFAAGMKGKLIVQ